MVVAHNRHLSTVLMSQVHRHVAHVPLAMRVTDTIVILALHALSIMEAVSLVQIVLMHPSSDKMLFDVNVQKVPLATVTVQMVAKTLQLARKHVKTVYVSWRNFVYVMLDGKVSGVTNQWDRHYVTLVHV